MGRVTMTTKNDDARAKRLKAALRENLKRRKGQVRGRGEPSGVRSEPDEAVPPGEPKPPRDGP